MPGPREVAAPPHARSRRHAWRAGIAAAVLSVAAAPEPANQSGQPALETPPGTVVRWTDPETTSCSLGDDTWEPVGDTCWFAIDLLAEPGPLTVRRWRGDASDEVTIAVGGYPYPEQRLTVEERMVHPPADQVDRIRDEQRRLERLWERDGPALFELPLEPPLDPMPAARSFGSRRILNGESRSPHGGIDLSADTGTQVRAAAAGTVVLADELYFSGNAVVVDHGGRLFTTYFHLSEIAVAEGDPVVPGHILGTVGATGRATGPHLHFGVRWRGARIDPMLLLTDPREVRAIPPLPRS